MLLASVVVVVVAVGERGGGGGGAALTSGGTCWLVAPRRYHAHQWNLDSNSPWGTSLNMTMLSAKLKGVGYSTHMVGKWGVGFFASEYVSNVPHASTAAPQRQHAPARQQRQRQPQL